MWKGAKCTYYQRWKINIPFAFYFLAVLVVGKICTFQNLCMKRTTVFMYSLKVKHYVVGLMEK